MLYPVGISIDPEQVIIGREDWLFLGDLDLYMNTRSVARSGMQQDDMVMARRIGDSTTAWNSWLASKGVQLYRVMLAPNKGTIYPEYLPRWAQPAKNSAADALITGTGAEFYVDLRPALIDNKTQSPNLLYYRTDTHWNSLGAWVGFQAFAESVSQVDGTLRWPSHRDFRVLQNNDRHGGDLGKFLRIKEHLPDIELVTELLAEHPIEITQYDIYSGKVIASGGNPRIDFWDDKHPVRVVSEHALNAKKVLWLRDSFGTAMSPFMAATFTEIVQVHWGKALKNSVEFSQLVEKWQPDYVFITVVERAALSPVFALNSPLPILYTEVQMP